jgi:hypothetical protein
VVVGWGGAVGATTIHLKKQHQIEHFFERVWSVHRSNTGNKIESHSHHSLGDGGGGDGRKDDGKDGKEKGGGREMSVARKPSAVASKNMASKKTMQLMRGGRRQSIMEMSGFGGDSMTEDVEEDEDVEDIDLPSDEEEDDKSSGSEDEDDEAYSKVEVGDDKFQMLCPIGNVLEIATDSHLQQCNRQKTAVWSTVAFVNSDKNNKGYLTLVQFRSALEGCQPKRSYEEVETLYSDIIYASKNNLMTYKTFKQSTFELFAAGDLNVCEVSEEDINETCIKLEMGSYIEKGEKV